MGVECDLGDDGEEEWVSSMQSGTSTSVQYTVFCFRIPRLFSIFVRDVSTIIKTTNIYITIINTTAR